MEQHNKNIEQPENFYCKYCQEEITLLFTLLQYELKILKILINFLQK